MSNVIYYFDPTLPVLLYFWNVCVFVKLQEKDKITKEVDPEPIEPKLEPVKQVPPVVQTNVDVVKAVPVQDLKQTPNKETSVEVKQVNLPDVTLVGEPKEEKEEVSVNNSIVTLLSLN